jgi:hypothetical protein
VALNAGDVPHTLAIGDGARLAYGSHDGVRIVAGVLTLPPDAAAYVVRR